MTIIASAVTSENDHGYEAGRYVAMHARAAFQSPPALLLACISDQYHKPDEVVRGIRSVVSDVPLIGGCAGSLITAAGRVQKGVSVLALRSDTLHTRFALATGMQSQPEQVAEHVLAQVQPAATNTRQDTPQDTPATLLFLASDIASGDDTALNRALHTTASGLPLHTTLAGAAVGNLAASHSGMVFVNDEVATDACAVAWIESPAPVGVGLSHTSADNLLDGTQAAARQAVAALGNRPPVAACIVISVDRSSESGGPGDPELERIREVLGRTTPIVGMYTSGAIAAWEGTASLHRGGVLVYVIGQ